MCPESPLHAATGVSLRLSPASKRCCLASLPASLLSPDSHLCPHWLLSVSSDSGKAPTPGPLHSLPRPRVSSASQVPTQLSPSPTPGASQRHLLSDQPPSTLCLAPSCQQNLAAAQMPTATPAGSGTAVGPHLLGRNSAPSRCHIRGSLGPQLCKRKEIPIPSSAVFSQDPGEFWKAWGRPTPANNISKPPPCLPGSETA